MIRRKKRRRQRRRRVFLLFVNLFILIYLGGFAYMQLNQKTKVVTIEAGSPMADVGEFLIDQRKDARFITDVSSLDLSRPGIYSIQIEMDGKVYHTSLRVVDTVPPKAVSVNYTAMKGETVTADSFVKNI
ncbi:MAG TPA: hypothetical protein DHW85_00500, partial [Lachnospiraceae bacterium]|nr:hypothetical protein [Lachnospiraceae bacterium]